MMGVAMVGNSPSDAFTHNELLAKCLAGCVAGFNPLWHAVSILLSFWSGSKVVGRYI